MAITKTSFGNADGKNVDLYTLSNGNGFVAKVATYGAMLVGLEAPDRDGKLADVVLGFDALEGYLAGGAVLRQHRWSGGEPDPKRRLRARRPALRPGGEQRHHHLHGGVKGWDKVVWTAEAMETADGPALRLATSPAMARKATRAPSPRPACTPSPENELRVAMRATTDAVTLVNMAHHSYWNLGGQDAGPITDHELTLFARAYTPGDPLVPTGEVAEVSGTSFDFRTPKPIGRIWPPPAGIPVGYDHNSSSTASPGRCARWLGWSVRRRGRVLTIEADQPGVQFYSGNYLDGSVRGKGGKPYRGQRGFVWRHSRSRTPSTSPPGATR